MDDLKQLEKRLRGALFRKRAVLIAAGLVALVSTGLGVLVMLSALAALFIITVPVKIGLLTLSMGAVAYSLYRYLIVPLSGERNIIAAAVQIEQRHPDLKGRLVAALQFRHYDLSKTNFSKTLIDMTGRQALEMTSGVNFNEIVSGYPLWAKLRTGGLVLAMAVLIGLIIPGIFSKAFEVYSQPTTVVAPPPGFSLAVTPGNVERVKYSDINIGAALLGGEFSNEAEIFYRFAEGRWQSEKINLLRRERYPTTMGDSLPFAITLKQVRRSFDYYVVAGDVRSQTFAVDIVERPRVANLALTVTYPAYSRLEPLRLEENNGSFAALVGSRAALEISANRDIKDGYLVIDDSTTMKIDFAGERGTVDFTVTKDFSYFIRLHDMQGEENPDPIEYMVTAVPDEFPVVRILYPGFDMNLDESMMIPFQVFISDDFGFSSLALKYQIVRGNEKGQENVAIINFSDQIETEGEVSFNWDVDRFDLLPSDYILYYFELADNDKISGPKVSATRVYIARLPSIDEIVKQTEADQAGRVMQADRVLQEQRDMVERLRQLAEQVRAKDKIDWQQQKDLENILQQQEKTADELEKMADNMEKSIEEMDKQNLLTDQIMQKMMELQKLFKEVATEEMKQAMEKLAEALKNMSQEEIEQAMKDFQMTQKEMLERLERSVELLKRMQIEQKMAAMLKMAEEILYEQNRVNIDTEEALTKENSSRMAQREEQLRNQMDALKKEADQLSNLLKDSPFAESEQHQQFAGAVKESQAPQDMQQMQQNLAATEMQQAVENGQQASSKLQKMLAEMQQLMASIAASQGQDLMTKIRQAIDDTNYLSQEQEKMHGECSGTTQRMQALGSLAAEQQVLREAVEGLNQRLNELGRQSPFLAAEIQAYLKECAGNMASAGSFLGENQKRVAMDLQRDAMYNLNRASVKLLDGLESQRQCNKGGSCNKMNQKMQSICNKQNQLNQETKGQCNKPGPKMSQSQQEAMQRLAAEQGSVRKSLQELQEEFGDRREILGRLDALAQEAREIEEMLEDGQVGEELTDRQLKIYSRMLDVQKSLNRRNFTRERQATSAEDIFRASPGPLENEGVQQNESLQDRLRYYLQEGYPRQYEQQIKAYFKAISNMGRNQNEN